MYYDFPIIIGLVARLLLLLANPVAILSFRILHDKIHFFFFHAGFFFVRKIILLHTRIASVQKYKSTKEKRGVSKQKLHRKVTIISATVVQWGKIFSGGGILIFKILYFLMKSGNSGFNKSHFPMYSSYF